ncbi:MAG: hypothetical protein ACI82F_002651 [Planctomycetota bacterium]|jgi:hypothetical protein
MSCKSGERAGQERTHQPPTRQRRQPEQGTLYGVLAEHLETFLAHASADETRPPLPRFVERELRGYLHCGLLCHGFARVHCGGCGKDILVAFSCKGRGFCPSCSGRRMAETAAKLVDRVIPNVPVRQWVLSLPWRLRYLLASDPALCRVVRRSYLRAVFAFYRSRIEAEGFPGGRTGSVNVVQRFGSALNLNIHFHTLLLDGVYTAASPFAPAVFHPVPEFGTEDIARLLHTIRTRILRLLQRRGLWPAPGEEDSATSSDIDQDSVLPFISAASIQNRIGLGPDSGKHIKRLGEASGDTDPFDKGARPLCAQQDGFSLHAEVHVEAHDRVRLEHLCRYVARGPLAAERLSLSPEGQVVLELRRPWRDGTTHFVFDPLTFIERLAALVPRPGVHQVTYHGVLAPASTWRDMIVPPPPPLDLDPAPAGHKAKAPAAQAAPPLQALAEYEAAVEYKAARSSPAPPSPSSDPYSWSALMRRVFRIDVLHCTHCGGRRKLIAFITHPPDIRRILGHLKLPVDPPPIAPARPPPQLDFAW